MSTVVVSVKPLEQVRREARDMLAAGRGDPTPRINFVSWELFHQVLSSNRIGVIRAMAGAGPMSIREVARRVGRDFKGVHTDVTALLRNGLLEKTPDGEVVFPYDDIHFDIRLSDAA
jgi:predicted transcriptional regulator